MYDLAVPTSPVLLWSGNIGVFAVMATDLRPGAVIFCSPSAETNMDTGGGVQWQTFTVDENDAVVPLDMPANLATLSANAWWLYNPNNKTLSIGTADGIYLFAADREGKLFTPIKTAAELAENNPDYGIYKPVFADDLSLLSVVSHTNPSSAAGGYRGDAAMFWRTATAGFMRKGRSIWRARVL